MDVQLERACRIHPVVLVTGARGVGKTTTALRAANTNAFLDDAATRTVFHDDPEAALALYNEPLLVDEWQLVPEVVRAIKRTVDRDRRPGRFILTGSPDPRGRSEFQALTGRAGVIRLNPMNMRELTSGGLGALQAQGVGWLNPMTIGERGVQVADPHPNPTVAGLLVGNPPAVSPKQALNIFGYLDLAAVGGFPACAPEGSVARSQEWCRDYLSVLLRQDLPLFGTRRSASHFRRYLAASALHTARSPEDGSLRKDAGVNPGTHRDYRHILLDMDVTVEVPAFSSEDVPSLAKSPKMLFSDSALLIAAMDVPLARLKLNGDLYGRVLETFVINQLRCELEALGMRDALSYLRTHKGVHEIDAVIETPEGGIIAIEIKSANRHRPGDAKHIEWLAEKVGDRFILGLVLTTGAHITKIRSNSTNMSDKIWSAPISVLWH